MDIFIALFSGIMFIFAIYGAVAFVAPGRAWTPFAAPALSPVSFNQTQVLFLCTCCYCLPRARERSLFQTSDFDEK